MMLLGDYIVAEIMVLSTRRSIELHTDKQSDNTGTFAAKEGTGGDMMRLGSCTPQTTTAFIDFQARGYHQSLEHDQRSIRLYFSSVKACTYSSHGRCRFWWRKPLRGFAEGSDEFPS